MVNVGKNHVPISKTSLQKNDKRYIVITNLIIICNYANK